VESQLPPEHTSVVHASKSVHVLVSLFAEVNKIHSHNGPEVKLWRILSPSTPTPPVSLLR